MINDNNTSSANLTTDQKRDYYWPRPKGFGLLCLPNGTIMEYEIPRCSEREQGHIKRLDSLFSNIAQKDDLNAKFSPIKRNGSDLRDRSEIYSSAYRKGGLQSIIEDHDRENSEFSELMDKPIRTLRDVYMGIRQDIKDRKKNRKNTKISESREISDCSDTDSEPVYHNEEDVEMEASQKRILEDKVYKLITHWNDMDYIKKNHQLFMDSGSKQDKEKEEEKVKIVKVESSTKIIEPPRTNTFMSRESKIVKPKKLRPLTKNKKRKMLTSDNKFFKNPVMVQEANKAT